MGSRYIYFAFQVVGIILLICPSCQNNSNKSSLSKADIELTTDSVKVNCTKNTKLNIIVNNQQLIDTVISTHWEAGVLSLLRKSSNKNQLAYDATQNNNQIPINIMVEGSCDTIFNYTIYPQPVSISSSINGICAKLVTPSNDPTNHIEARKWLYRHQLYLPDSLINNYIDVLNELNKSDNNIYITSDNIPVINNFSNKIYSVTSDLKAKYYILFAASTQKDINDFIEDIIANNFELTVSSLNEIKTCYRTLNSDGYKCIFLIGINDNWSHSQIPLGLIAIDNTPPNKALNKSDVKQLVFRDNTIIKLPTDKPEIFGNCNVSVPTWDGNGLECNVTFLISYSGDVKFVTIKREGSLARTSYYNIGSKNFTYNLDEEKNPLLFNIKMHFENGDNFIPIVIEDHHGNYFDEKIKINARFERRDTHDINVYNY